jgi:hypothetical protein
MATVTFSGQGACIRARGTVLASQKDLCVRPATSRRSGTGHYVPSGEAGGLVCEKGAICLSALVLASVLVRSSHQAAGPRAADQGERDGTR